MSPTDDEVFRLLIMCTANQCRSPMAAVMAAELLEHHGANAVVASCGSMEGGMRASAGAIKAMSRRGLDLSAHLSQRVDLDTIEAADLIITMERRHVMTIAELSVAAVNRTFTLTELADLSAVVGSRTPGMTVRRWIASATSMRHPSAALALDPGGDIDDPMGGPNRAYRRTAERLAVLLESVIARMYPMPPEALGR